MRNSRYFLLFVLLLSLATGLYAQEEGRQAKKVWQFTGLIADDKSGEPVPFAKVQVNHSRRGMFSTFEGYFSLPVVADDTLFFYSIGYSPTKIIIADYLEDYEGDKDGNYLYGLIRMKEDSIVLPTVTIYPYNTPEKLKAAILNIGADPNSPEALAADNLDPQLMENYFEGTELDAGERMMVGRQLYYQQYRQQSMIPTATLFDPVSMMNYVNHINRKAKKKKNKDLNHWE